jgi:hypothetical protein
MLYPLSYEGGTSREYRLGRSWAYLGVCERPCTSTSVLCVDDGR